MLLDSLMSLGGVIVVGLLPRDCRFVDGAMREVLAAIRSAGDRDRKSSGPWCW
jgi:hypothetical protein